MREIRMSGLMSGEGKRNTLQRVTAPFLDSTGRNGKSAWHTLTNDDRKAKFPHCKTRKASISQSKFAPKVAKDPRRKMRGWLRAMPPNRRGRQGPRRDFLNIETTEATKDKARRQQMLGRVVLRQRDKKAALRRAPFPASIVMVEASRPTLSFAIISMLPAMPSIVIAMPVTAAVVGTTIMTMVSVAAAALDTANNPTGHFTTFIVLDL